METKSTFDSDLSNGVLDSECGALIVGENCQVAQSVSYGKYNEGLESQACFLTINLISLWIRMMISN